MRSATPLARRSTIVSRVASTAVRKMMLMNKVFIIAASLGADSRFNPTFIRIRPHIGNEYAVGFFRACSANASMRFTRYTLSRIAMPRRTFGMLGVVLAFLPSVHSARRHLPLMLRVILLASVQLHIVLAAVLHVQVYLGNGGHHRINESIRLLEDVLNIELIAKVIEDIVIISPRTALHLLPSCRAP